jgi:hypothetical protein
MSNETTLTETARIIEQCLTERRFRIGKTGHHDYGKVRVCFAGEDEIVVVVFTNDLRRCVEWSVNFDAHSVPWWVIRSTIDHALGS